MRLTVEAKIDGNSQLSGPLHIGRHAHMMATFSSITVQAEEATSYVGSELVDEKLRVCIRKMLVMVTLVSVSAYPRSLFY